MKSKKMKHYIMFPLIVMLSLAILPSNHVFAMETSYISSNKNYYEDISTLDDLIVLKEI